MAIVISGSGIDMGGNPVSNASQIDSTVINENGSNVRTESDSYSKTETDGKIIGTGQTWQDVTASRSVGVTYTNTTGKPILVNISSVATVNIYIGQIYISQISGDNTVGVVSSSTFIVPNGQTYNTTGGAPTHWFELR